MNMQNIPSHATDIRHMFRATPEMDVTLDCDSYEDDNIVVVAVTPCTSFKTPDGYTQVEDLHESDSIILLHDGNPEAVSIISITNKIIGNKFEYIVTCKPQAVSA